MSTESLGPPPIEGVRTSTAGFVGETERGPTRPTLVTSWPEYVRTFGGYIDQPPLNAANAYLPYAARGFFDNGGQRLYIARVIGASAATAAGELAGAEGPTVIRAIGPGDWGNRIRIAVRPASASVALPPGSSSPEARWFRLLVLYYRELPDPFVDPTDPTELTNPARREPDVLEDFDNLTHDSALPNDVVTTVNSASLLTRIGACSGPPDLVEFANGVLAGSSGSYAAADLNAFIGEDAHPEKRTGLDGLLTIREISLMSIPDEVRDPNLTDALLDRCEAVKDRVAVLNEATDGVDFETIAQHRDSSYGAVYYPRIRVLAPHTPEGHRLVPPSGHVAGIYARTDIERGVHRPPANEVLRGNLSGDLSGGLKPLSHTLNDQEQQQLVTQGVNVIRDFRPVGRGIRLWSARTMSSNAQWRYVNVRRLFIFLEESIDRGTQWAVFESNGEPLWSAIRTSIATFLRGLWRQGAFMGATEDEAFFITCDRTTMTQDDIDNGRLICLVGVAPLKPAEFVIFRISEKTHEAET